MVQWTFPEGDRDYLRLIQRLPLDVGSVPHKQNVVSRAILKGFAAPGTSGRGWSLTPFNVARNEAQKDRGLRGCAYVEDFIMYAAQSAERAWKAVEDRLPPAIPRGGGPTRRRDEGREPGRRLVLTSDADNAKSVSSSALAIRSFHREPPSMLSSDIHGSAR
jgi:hypothetical protein